MAAIRGTVDIRSRLFREVANEGFADDPCLLELLSTESLLAGLSTWFGQDALSRMSNKQASGRLARDIVEIDAKISELMEAILHADQLRRLESLWRSVKWLLEPITARARPRVIIKLLNATWRDVVRDLTKSPDFDQTTLFQRIYSDEFGTAGGTPMGLVVGAYEIRHKPTETFKTDDVGILRDLARIAEAAFCPIVLEASPSFFGINHLNELSRRENIETTFQQKEYDRFRSFQRVPSARFIALTVGKIIVRDPNRERGAGDLGYVHAPSHHDGVGGLAWGPSSFAIGQVVVRSFQQFAWPAAMRGAPSRDSEDDIAGGVISPAVEPAFITDADKAGRKIPLEVAITDAQEAKLNALGFIAPRPCPYTKYAAIYTAPTTHRPRSMSTDVAAQNARMGAMVNYLLCVCRFAHYIKVIARDWIGSFKTAQDCQKKLQKWINKYCIAGEEVGYTERAKFPLRQAQIKIADMDGRPGVYSCVIHLKPHFQLDYVVSEFELSTEIEAPAQAA